MKLSEQSKEDITDDVIESRDVEEDDLTTAYLKGYADAEEKYRKRIKELEKENEELLEVKISCSAVNIIKNLQKENKNKQKAYDDCYCEYKKYKQFDSIPKQKVKETIYTIIDYKIPRTTNSGYYYDYFIKQEYKNDFVKLFNKLLEDK